MRRPPLSALLGLALVALFLVVAAFAPLLAPYPPSQPVGGLWDPASPRPFSAPTISAGISCRASSGARG